MDCPLAEAEDRLPAPVAVIAATHAHYTTTRTLAAAVMVPDDLEAIEEKCFWLEREVTRLRAGEGEPEGPAVSDAEMAQIMRQRRWREEAA